MELYMLLAVLAASVTLNVWLLKRCLNSYWMGRRDTLDEAGRITAASELRESEAWARLAETWERLMSRDLTEFHRPEVTARRDAMDFTLKRESVGSKVKSPEQDPMIGAINGVSGMGRIGI